MMKRQVVYALVGVAACLSGAARADVDLFPKKALQPAPRDLPQARAIDPAWRAVERSALAEFQPRASQLTDDKPQTLLAKQIARRRNPPPTPPDRGSDDSRATSNEPRLLYEQREHQADLAQAAYEEPAAWERIELEAAIDAQGTLTGVRVVSGSPRPGLNELALAAVRHAIGAGSGLATHGAVIARIAVEAGVSVAMPARAQNMEVRPRPKGVMVPVVRGQFGGGRKTEVSGPLQPRVRTRVTILGLDSP